MRIVAKNMKHGVVAALALAASAPGAAATLTYSNDFGSSSVPAEWTVGGTYSQVTGALGRIGVGNTSATLGLNSGGASTGAGSLTFDLYLYNTIDGFGTGQYDDLFSIGLNGTTLFSGYFAPGKGGAGSEQILSNAGGVTYSIDDSGSIGIRSFVVPLTTILAGSNSFAFTYDNLQDLGDESWALDNVVIRAPIEDSTSAAPEPASWAMMVGGFGLVGAAMRRRQKTAVRFA